MSLAYEVVTAPAGKPEAFLVFLHGILGSGANFRSFARKVVNARPTWGAVLVDLRMHGGSRAMSPPHTVASAADDLRVIESQVPAPIRAILGHSFGGKVALTYLEERARREPSAMRRLFLLDSNPGMRREGRGSEGTLAIVDMLRTLPATFASRQAFVSHVQSLGHTAAISQWLAMNLVRMSEGDAFRFAIDLSAIDALLADYFTRDLWHVLEPPPADVRIVAINGGASTVYDEEASARLAGDAAKFPEQVAVHTLAGIGHWIHAEAFERTTALVIDELPCSSDEQL